MPSPFPGMDPYLEGLGWPSTHQLISFEIGRDLCRRLPDGMVARCLKDYLGVDQVPQITIELRDVPARSVVTRIRLLTAADADLPPLPADGHGVDIDLRGGVWRPHAGRYEVVTRRVGRDGVTVRSVSLREPLPTISVPTRRGAPDVMVDLQATLTTVYDWYGFDRELNYSRPPPIPLNPADVAWAAELVAKRLQ